MAVAVEEGAAEAGQGDQQQEHHIVAGSEVVADEINREEIDEHWHEDGGDVGEEIVDEGDDETG